MGIVEEVLADFKLDDGSEWTVEYNTNDKIHIHIDNVRIRKSPDEFRLMVEAMKEGRQELYRIKQLDVVQDGTRVEAESEDEDLELAHDH